MGMGRIRGLSRGVSFASAAAVRPEKDDAIAIAEASLHELAADTASDAVSNFHEMMPPTLVAEMVDHDETDCTAPFQWEECILGRFLGSGEFAHVFEVKSFCFRKETFQASADHHPEWASDEMDQRCHMKQMEKYHDTKNPRYALKHIKPSFLKTCGGRKRYVQALRDLATEREFLTRLSHPNIIKLRGIAHSGPTGFALVVDCLVETLDQRMMRWRKTKLSSKLRTSLTTTPSASFTKVKPELNHKDKVLDERLSIAFEIAAAMMYLHSHNILFRDLKPRNIGFAVRGDTKLFDFGLARFCPGEGGPNNDELFLMSMAGTPRYMAPECLSGRPYNMKADVFAFGIVLWEILAGKHAYAFAQSAHCVSHFVVEEQGRPDIDPSWPAGVKRLLKDSFATEIEERPDMKSVYKSLVEVIVALRDGDRTGMDDLSVSRRRSMLSEGLISHQESVLSVASSSS